MTEEVTDGLAQPKRKWAMVAIALGISVAVLDGAIANVALPTIASDLHINPASSIWIVNAFQLAVTISLLAFSSLGDLWGYKRVYVVGLLMFSVTSLICALSDSFVTLVVARGLQGFSAAANWPWLFAINVPIGLLAFVLGQKFLPQNPVKLKNQRFDVTSAILNALTFGLLICVIDGFAHDIHWYILVPGMGVMLILGWFFIQRQLHHPYPLLPVDLMHSRIFSLSLLTSVFSFIAQMLALVSIPFFFQRVLHLSEVVTGLLLTPWLLATMIAAPLAGRLMNRVNAGLLSGIGLLIFGVALFLLAHLPADPTHWDIVWRMIVGGIGFGIFITPNNSTIIASAPKERTGGASGMLGMARLLGQTVGAAFAAVIFAVFPGHGMRYSLIFGAALAVISAVISSLRIHHQK